MEGSELGGYRGMARLVGRGQVAHEPERARHRPLPGEARHERPQPLRGEARAVHAGIELGLQEKGPAWGMKVFLVYAPRRVEEMPWAEGKHPMTRTYAWFLASWAKRLSWKEVAEVFQSSWDVVFGAVEMAVAYGREHLDRSGIQSLGID